MTVQFPFFLVISIYEANGLRIREIKLHIYHTALNEELPEKKIEFAF